MKMRQALFSAFGAMLLCASTSASASILSFFAPFTLEGPVSPSGTGTASITFDTATNVMSFDVIFSGLSSPTTVAHVHCCTDLPLLGNAGVVVEPPTLEGFPVGVLAGHYVKSIDLDDIGNVNPAFVTANGGSLENAIAVLIRGLGEGRGYFNIHTEANRGGEIRARVVPEPATLGLMAMGLLGMAVRRRRSQT